MLDQLTKCTLSPHLGWVCGYNEYMTNTNQPIGQETLDDLRDYLSYLNSTSENGVDYGLAWDYLEIQGIEYSDSINDKVEAVISAL